MKSWRWLEPYTKREKGGERVENYEEQMEKLSKEKLRIAEENLETAKQYRKSVHISLAISSFSLVFAITVLIYKLFFE